MNKRQPYLCPASHYRVLENRSRRGSDLRRCYEICECGPRGGVHRVLARTPIIVGEDEPADRRAAEAKADAERMLRGLLTPDAAAHRPAEGRSGSG